MTHPTSPRAMKRDDGTVMGGARALADTLGADEIPRLEPIAGNVVRCNRKSYWPPEVWAEMQAVWNGSEQ